MAINWTQFNTTMLSYTTSCIATSMSDYINFFLTQLELAMVTATNPFGQTVLKTNISVSKGQAKALLELEKMAGYKNEDAIINIIANSLYVGLTGTILSPLPPIPPTVLPNPALPNTITYGGNVEVLKMDLKRSLMFSKKIKTPAMAMSLLIISLKKYFLTVSGFYNGLVYAGSALVPSPPIPWSGLF